MKEKNEVQNKHNTTKNLKQGFTLLELLIVVVIIGILAAIALPQYRKIVEKARMSEAIIMVEKIADAQERYYLINNDYTRDINDLDIDIIGEDTTYSGRIPAIKGKFFKFASSNASGTQNYISIVQRNKGTYILAINKNKQKWCLLYKDVSKHEEELCRDWGTVRDYR